MLACGVFMPKDIFGLKGGGVGAGVEPTLCGMPFTLPSYALWLLA
jgi:hypothetical protein